MSARGITVSTVGLVPAIDRLAAEGCRSPSRCRCTPRTTSCATSWSRSTPAGRSAEALDAARRYFDATGRRVSIEYALIRDINDQAWRADLLGTSSTAAAAAGCT